MRKFLIVCTVGFLAVMLAGVGLQLAGYKTPVATASEPSILSMTQAERKAAYLARQDADTTSPESRARWACSARLKEAAYAPATVEWTRRPRWPVVQLSPGVFDVQADFTASNRLGVELTVAKRCRVTVSDQEARVVKVS